MMLQGKDLYLSCTILCITDTAEGSHKALTSLVNPSTVGALFLHPRTSLHCSSYSACKYCLVIVYSDHGRGYSEVQFLLILLDIKHYYNLQYNPHSSRSLYYQDCSEDSLIHPAAS